MRIEVLGCNSVIGPGLDTTSFLLNEDTLIDAGSGAGRLDVEAAARIRRVFLTHSHLDHILGLPSLFLTLMGRQAAPVEICGLPQTLDALRAHVFNWTIWPDFSLLPSPQAPSFVYRPMNPGDRCSFDGVSVQMFAVNHIVAAVGYRVESPLGVWAFSGDTATTDGFWQALNAGERLNLLFVECAFSDEDAELASISKHYCPSTLAADLEKLRHRPAIFLSHLQGGRESLILEQCLRLMPTRAPRRLQAGDLFTLPLRS